MLVGSMASNYWGIPRSTHDIDFVLQYQTTDAKKIVRAFEDAFFIQEQSVVSATRPPYQFNALDNRSALKVDFFAIGDDVYEQVRFQRRLSITLFDQPAFIARPEDVVLYKLRWYAISPSDRQLSDAEGILAVSGSVMDFAYLTHWADKIAVSDLFRNLRK